MFSRLLLLLLAPFLRTKGTRRARAGLARELRNQRRHRGGMRAARRFRGRRGLELNVGCGSNVREGWVNVDLSSREADCRLDLREDLPFEDASVAFVTSEHFFEHLDYPDDALHFLRECLRVLEPGGGFSVGVPDTEEPLRSYVAGDGAYAQRAREKWKHPAWCATALDHVNHHFRQEGEHRWAYDFESLAHALGTAGFEAVRRRSVDPARDTEARAEGTLYVEARKPDA
ncbi:MAG: methyltransferase domain-containing protein [Planctomycetota bacterium]